MSNDKGTLETNLNCESNDKQTKKIRVRITNEFFQKYGLIMPDVWKQAYPLDREIYRE